MNSWLPVMISVLGFLLAAAMEARAQPARIIIIRHAEKPADEGDSNLSDEGRVRAQRLPAWLSEPLVLGDKGPPAALFAAAPSAHGSGVRCMQTLEPASRHFNLPIRAPHRPGEFAKLARLLLRSTALREQTVVVCWSHNELPKLAAALGVKPQPPKWKEKDFSSAYIITFPEGSAVLEHIKPKSEKKKKKK